MVLMESVSETGAEAGETDVVFLNTLPLWLSGALLVGLTTLLAMAGPVLIRRGVDRAPSLPEVSGAWASRDAHVSNPPVLRGSPARACAVVKADAATSQGSA